jgi:hypothetical protein
MSWTDFGYTSTSGVAAGRPLASWRRLPRPAAGTALRRLLPRRREAPEAPNAPDASKAPEARVGPKPPKAPDAPVSPDAPEAPEAPDAPEPPKTPKAPRAADAFDGRRDGYFPPAPPWPSAPPAGSRALGPAPVPPAPVPPAPTPPALLRRRWLHRRLLHRRLLHRRRFEPQVAPQQDVEGRARRDADRGRHRELAAEQLDRDARELLADRRRRDLARRGGGAEGR